MSAGSPEYEVALAQTACPEPERSDCELVEGVLQDHGVIADAGLVKRLDTLIDVRAFRRAGEALRHILQHLPDNSVSTVALRRAILGHGGRSLRADAKLTKTSAETLRKHERKLRQAINRVDRLHSK
jgi:hypothetical protein